MKWHLNIISFIINLSIIGYSLFCLITALAFLTIFKIGSYESLREAVLIDFFSGSLTDPSPVVLYTFLFLNIILHLYLIRNLLIIRKCISRIYSGKILYNSQSGAFKRAGNGLVIFAVLRYLLLLVTGMFFLDSDTALITALPGSVTFFFIGEILLILATITKKGQDLKVENDLTI